MAENRDYSLGDQLVRGGHGLGALAIVVGRDDLHLLTQHAASGVEVGNGEFGALLRYRARPCHRSSQRRAEADPDFGVGWLTARHHPQHNGYGTNELREFHRLLPD
jgi:hypothetical protein